MSDSISLHFQHSDPKMAILWQQHGPISLTKTTDYFFDLCQAIISQQLSVKAADTIGERFTSLFAERRVVSESVIALEDQTLRDVGLSWSKVSFIKDLAAKVISGELVIAELDNFSDTEVIEQLVAVKGIGPWTAEMFLIFSLGREDVFSCGDGGLQRAVMQVYGLEQKQSKEQLLELSEKWAPYRSYASRVLWKSLG